MRYPAYTAPEHVVRAFRRMPQLLAIAALCLHYTAAAQPVSTRDSLPDEYDSDVVTMLITEDGDTILLANFGEVAITDTRYTNRKERYHHYRVKRRAVKVYPYAVTAIKLFREVQEETQGMGKRKRKRHIKEVHKELKEKFEDPLRKLSRYEGYVLICMIERELDEPLYEVIKGLRGWWTASYWNTFSRVYGFDLKSGYDPTLDPVIENVLSDLKLTIEEAKANK